MRIRHAVLSHAFFYVLASYSVWGAEPKCYFPNGNWAPNDRVCGELEGSVGFFCCGEGYACLSNKLCRPPSPPRPLHSDWKNPYVRGSCTDRNWASLNCPVLVCRDRDRDIRDGSMGLARCLNVRTERFQCTSDNVADMVCDVEADLFDVEKGKCSM